RTVEPGNCLDQLDATAKGLEPSELLIDLRRKVFDLLVESGLIQRDDTGRGSVGVARGDLGRGETPGQQLAAVVTALPILPAAIRQTVVRRDDKNVLEQFFTQLDPLIKLGHKIFVDDTEKWRGLRFLRRLRSRTRHVPAPLSSGPAPGTAPSAPSRPCQHA